MKTLVYVRPGADAVELCTKVDNGIFEVFKLQPDHARLLAEDLLRVTREINNK